MATDFSRRDFGRRLFSLGALSAASLAGLSALGGKQALAQSMGTGGGGAGSGAIATTGSGGAMIGAGGTGKPLLVMVNMMGGVDGLNWMVPFSNQTYYDRRPNIAISADQALDMQNGLIRMHPGWSALHDSVWQDGEMAVIQQVGYPQNNKSHFKSADIWSLARRDTANGDPRGWLGRLVEECYAEEAMAGDFPYFALGWSAQYRQLQDFVTNNPDYRPLVLERLANFNLRYEVSNDDAYRNMIAEAQSQLGDGGSGYAAQIRSTRQRALANRTLLQAADTATPQDSAYGNTGLGTSLREAAKLVQADVGTRVVYTGIGGFDTHANQAGSFGGNLQEVSDASAAFVQDLKDLGRWQDTCIVFYSEFGRNCFENGSVGTDHGFGNNMVVIGGGVNGGLYGNTVSEADLQGQHVPYQIDFRSVLRQIVQDHMGEDPSVVFDSTVADTSTNLSDSLFG